MGNQNKANIVSTTEKQKKFLLIVRRALLMVVRGIEELYPEEFARR